MGSTPISSTLPSLTLVIDSPPLQALHRCGALRILERAHREVLVPRSIAEETARSRSIEGPSRVPDLADHPAIVIRDVGDELVDAAGAVLLGESRATKQYRLDAHKIDRPELEVVLLARSLSAVVVAENKAAVRIAGKLSVPVVGTAELLCDLEVRGLLDDAVAAAQAIRATKYLTKDLILLASGTRRRQWRTELALALQR